MDIILYKYGTHVALRYWNCYKDKYLKACIDKEDLIQEANIVTCKAIKDYDEKRCSTLKEYIEIKVSNRMKNIKDRTFRDEILENKIEVERKEKLEARQVSSLFLDIESLCSSLEYKLIVMKFKENRDFRDISSALGIPKSSVYRLYEKIMKKLGTKPQKNLI